MINKLISSYLIHSYIYYEKGTSIISDAAYDQIIGGLLDDYESVETATHPHKGLVTKGRLTAGTGYDITFPTIVQVCGNQMLLNSRRVTHISEKPNNNKESNLRWVNED